MVPATTLTNPAANDPREPATREAASPFETGQAAGISGIRNPRPLVVEIVQEPSGSCLHYPAMTTRPILPVDAAYVRHLLENLIRINSVNPGLDGSAPGEGEIADYLALEFRRLGLEAHVHEPAPGRRSVVGILRGKGSAPTLMLNGHIDTVDVRGMDRPFEPELASDRISGRGSYDMKGAVAACIGAAKALRDADVCLAGDLLVACVADEEVASIGTLDLLNHYAPAAAIVTEPSDLEVCVAHKGFTWIAVTARGRAAHGSQYEIGVDANARMGRVLAALEDLDKSLARHRHPLLGRASVHAATLRGGTGASTYAAECVLEIERRTLPGESVAVALAEIEAILAHLRESDASFNADCRVLLSREPFETRADSPIASIVRGSAAKVRGHPVPVRGENPWMDAAILAAAGVDTVVIGPVGGGAHGMQEWVEFSSIVQLAEILALSTIDYCGVIR